MFRIGMATCPSFPDYVDHSCSELRPSHTSLVMASLLLIASRVEAAVNSYVSVRDITDKEAWKANFQREKVSASFIRRFEHHPYLL